MLIVPLMCSVKRGTIPRQSHISQPCKLRTNSAQPRTVYFKNLGSAEAYVKAKSAKLQVNPEMTDLAEDAVHQINCIVR